MGKIGRISTVKRDYSNSGIQTMQSELSRNNMTRIPGTGVFRYPYKELDGKYRTGLDPTAAYINRIQDPLEKELEIERVTSTLERLQSVLGDINLGPRAPFWNHGLSLSAEDQTHVQSVKLLDGDNFFDLSTPFQEIAFNWLRVHPTIASSHQAWERGDYPADTQFYVADEEVENKIVFKKKQLINKAISKFDAMTPEKKKKVARMLGLAVTDNSEFKSGKFQGLGTVEVFNRYADMQESLLHIRDLVKQAVTHSVYRLKPNGKLYEGEYEIAEDEDTLIKLLADDDNQDMLLMLESKVKSKKIAST
jgi:hypothetical protein